MAIKEGNEKTTVLHPDAALIDAFGVTNLARVCRIKPPSVSWWRRVGIPDARWDFLELKFPESFPTDKREAA
jgi:hypothetical protein